MKTIDAFVIGAGPAGLTTAYQLAKAGRSVHVVEQDPVYVGGISRTVNYKGFLFDIGGHRFFSKSKEVVDLWNEILPDDFIDRPRLSRIYYKNKFYAYPLKAFEALRNLGLGESIACVASYGWARLRPVVDATAVRVRDGETLVSDGPFAETKDFVGGFVIVDCESLDEAIAIAAGHPYARWGGVEIRPVWE